MEKGTIKYIEGEDERVVGHIEPTSAGGVVVVKIEMSWESEEAHKMDWNGILFDLFEEGDDFGNSLPHNSTIAVSVQDKSGVVY